MTWEHWQHACKHLGMLATGLGAPGTSLDAPQITVNQAGNNDIFENIAGAPRNHRYYSLFNGFLKSCIQFVFSSMYIYSYPSTHSISGLAADGAWEQFEVCLRMAVELSERYALRLGASEYRATFGGRNQVDLEIALNAVIERVWRYTWRP